MTQVIRRYNGTTQHLHYQTAVPIAERPGLVRLYLDEDSCGCLREVLADRNRLLAEQDFTPAVFTPHFVYVSPQAETRKTRHEKGQPTLTSPSTRPTYVPIIAATGRNWQDRNTITASRRCGRVHQPHYHQRLCFARRFVCQQQPAGGSAYPLAGRLSEKGNIRSTLPCSG